MGYSHSLGSVCVRCQQLQEYHPVVAPRGHMLFLGSYTNYLRETRTCKSVRRVCMDPLPIAHTQTSPSSSVKNCWRWK